MWEIAENLHRAELSALERDENVAEWIKLADEVEKLNQSESVSNKGGRGKKSGVRKAAREIGVSQPDAHRAVKVASLTPEAKEVARATGLDDNRSALLAASKAAPEQQAQVIQQIADQKVERALLKQRRFARKMVEWLENHVNLTRNSVSAAVRERGARSQGSTKHPAN